MEFESATIVIMYFQERLWAIYECLEEQCKKHNGVHNNLVSYVRNKPHTIIIPPLVLDNNHCGWKELVHIICPNVLKVSF